MVDGKGVFTHFRLHVHLASTSIWDLWDRLVKLIACLDLRTILVLTENNLQSTSFLVHMLPCHLEVVDGKGQGSKLHRKSAFPSEKLV